jgi:hypothetical protein
MKFLAGKTLAFRFVDSFCCIHRHFDEIFLTWNESQDALDRFIHRMNVKNSSIQVQSTIGTDIDYREAHIRFLCDDDDPEMELETKVNHESKVEPYALPYVYDHPPDQYSTLIRAAMIRAARCCSDIYEFQKEWQYIELSFNINNFPIGFINEHITVFFLEFNMEEFDHTMYDRETYEELRENVIKHEQKCLQRKMERQEQAHEYNLQYVSLSTKRSGFAHLKRYSQRHRKRAHGSHSKLYFDIVGRPSYPANTK